MKKYLSLTLALLMVLSATTVFAETKTVPVTLTVEEPTFSVALPLSLPITIEGNGDITTAINAQIINNSAGPVAITNIQTQGINGWTTLEYGTLDMTTAKVDSKQATLQLEIKDKTIKTTGTDINDFSGFIRLAKGETAPLTYNAEVPAQKTAKTDAQIVEVLFTVGWDE